LFAWQLYRQLIRPLNLLITGADAIRERDFNTRFLKTGKYEMDQLIEVYNQMIDELRFERTQQEQQHFFLEKLIATSPTGIVILDYDEKVHQLNPRALQLMHLQEKEVIGQPVTKLKHPIFAEISRLPSGKSETIAINGIEAYKIQKSHFIDRGFARYFIMIEELTVELLAAEKKAYGKVIRMMAHEVNNTIGPVNSILESALQSRQTSEPIQNALQVAIDRNKNLDLFMRNFADVVRLPLPDKKTVDLNKLVQGVVQLMSLKAGEKQIRFKWEPSKYPFLLSCDIQQLEQVLINIIKNALEAISESGTISILLQEKPKQLVIRDSGKGIDPAISPELFSPFFSTKKEGQGIGLTIIRDVLLSHGYTFSLQTKPEGYTEFQIFFDNTSQGKN